MNEQNNVLMEDRRNRGANLKHLKPVDALIFEPVEAVSFSGKDPDEIKYLLLLKIEAPDNYDDSYYEWFVKIGRQTTYNYLKDLVRSSVVDLHNSYVVSDGITFDKAITVYSFLKKMKDEELVVDTTDFNVDDCEGFDDNEDGKLVDCIDDHGTEYKYVIE